MKIYKTIEEVKEDKENKNRYAVVAESVSAHCCFEATVIDTKENYNYTCECFEQEDAIKIANALNIL